MKNVIIYIMLIGGYLLFSSHTERNLITIWVKADGKILVKGRYEPLERISEIVKNYILNPKEIEWYPEKRKKKITYFGLIQVSKAVVSIQCDRETKYGDYIAVQNEIEKAFNEMRNDQSIEKFGVSYSMLEPKQQKAVDLVIPKKISEAEPNYIRDKNGNLVKNNLR